MTKPPPDAVFVVNPSIGPETSSAPEEIRASEDEDYCPEQGFDVFPWEIADEGGPDGSVYLMGAQWEGVTHVVRQQDDMRDGYFVSARKEGPWKWVLWRCTWDDNYSAWSWEASGATSWDTKDPAAAGREMVLRLWQSWRDQGPPSDTDYRGLLDGEAVADLVTEAFRPKRRPKKSRTPPTESTTAPEPQATTPPADSFMGLLQNLESMQVPLAGPDEGKGQWETRNVPAPVAPAASPEDVPLPGESEEDFMDRVYGPERHESARWAEMARRGRVREEQGHPTTPEDLRHPLPKEVATAAPSRPKKQGGRLTTEDIVRKLEGE